MTKMQLNIIVEKGENGFLIGQLTEYPAVLSQGKDLDELKENLIDALKLYLEVQREDIEKQYKKRKTVRRKLVFKV